MISKVKKSTLNFTNTLPELQANAFIELYIHR